jgi:hypothetical protein
LSKDSTSEQEAVQQLLDSGAVQEYATWCSFCNSEQASGEITAELGFGDPVTLPIGPNCLEQAAGEGFLDDLHVDTDSAP